MQLTLNGIAVQAAPGDSLLTLSKKVCKDDGTLRTKPLAAMIAGDVYSLHFQPLGTEEDPDPDGKHAVRVAGGNIRLLTYADPLGQQAYERSLLLLFLAAARRLHPDLRIRVDYSVGKGLHITPFREPPFSGEELRALLKECGRIVSEAIPLKKKTLDIGDAIEFFGQAGREDLASLLEWRRYRYFNTYRIGNYADYFYGEMVPDTSYLTVFDLITDENAWYLMLPDPADPTKVYPYVPNTKLAGVFRESNTFAGLLSCNSVTDLNEAVIDGRIREIVRINESLHERSFSRFADEIVDRGAMAVLIAGPSSSGKTTSANRLCNQLRVHGLKPILLSMDNYYIDRDKLTPDETGKLDLEHINALDTDLFRSDLEALLKGEPVRPPRFDFVLQKRVMDLPEIRLSSDTPIVIEGIHALNPVLLPEGIDKNRIYRLYVTALTTMNLDDHNRIRTTDLRLLRRIVRDYATRGASVQSTLEMWDSVRRGEERWIFPWQEEADAVFNSSLVYEPAVLKRHIFPILQAVRPQDSCYAQVRSLIKFLNYIVEADVEDEIPPTSLLREFIGGNTFYL